MSFTEKRLCNPTQLTTSGQTLYTVPASKTSIIKQIVVTNVTASAATFSLYIGSALTSNSLFSATSVAANDTIIINLSQVLSQNEILTALASANSTLNIIISGVENDGPLNPLSIYIADNAITTAKIADGAVNTLEIADGAVTTQKIAAGAVATIDIANNAVTQAKLDTAVPLSGMRNAIINGGMEIYQRVSFVSTNGYSLDRWHINSGVNATVTQSTALTTPNSRYSMLAVASGTQQIFIRQVIETANAYRFAGKTVTLSAYAAGLTTTTNLNMTLEWSATVDNLIGGTWTSLTPTSGGNLTLSGVMTRFQGTFTVPSTARSLRVQFVNNAANITVGQGIYLADVQLEEGTQVTPFEQRPIGLETTLCQRYYQTGTLDDLPIGPDTYYNVAHSSFLFPVPMRATPVGTFNGQTFAPGSGSGMNKSGSIGGTYQRCQLTTTPSAVWWYYGSWTASAEL